MLQGLVIAAVVFALELLVGSAFSLRLLGPVELVLMLVVALAVGYVVQRRQRQPAVTLLALVVAAGVFVLELLVAAAFPLVLLGPIELALMLVVALAVGYLVQRHRRQRAAHGAQEPASGDVRPSASTAAE